MYELINIQIFTDGGVFTSQKISISTGIVFVDKKKVITCNKINYNKTSDFAELFAINKLLSRTYGYCRQKDILDENLLINIYTDSLSSINGIMSKEDSNNERRNELLHEIREAIDKFDNRVIFYHIKSHVSGSNLKTAYKMFCKENNVDISFDDFLFIYQQNKKCDKTVSKEFKKYMKAKKIQEGLKTSKMNELVDDEFDPYAL